MKNKKAGNLNGCLFIFVIRIKGLKLKIAGTTNNQDIGKEALKCILIIKKIHNEKIFSNNNACCIRFIFVCKNI